MRGGMATDSPKEGKSRREESNLRPMVYETIALPLSYAGDTIAIIPGLRGASNGR